MSTHKYFDRICIIVLVITLVVTVLFINGKKLGLISVVDEDAETYEGDANFTKNDYNGIWNKEDACVITLKGDSAKVKGNGAYFYDNKLVIAGGGYYVLSGSLDSGQIVVDAYDSSKVFMKLNGVEMYCPDDAALRVDQADKVFLTLAEGTENKLSSGGTYSDEALLDGAGGVIFTHDDLTINGSGTLDITAEYKHGIVANDDLVITGGRISVTAPEDAFHVNDAFKFTGAALTVNAGDDAIHADERILVAGGSILINECYEGMESLTVDIQDGDVEIHPSDDGINANGGSQDMFGDFGGGPGGLRDTAEKEETGTEDSTDEETWVHISGGTVTIINDSGMDADGIDSNGDILITGGDVRVSLNGSGTNNAIDYGSESGGICKIDGGTVIACGGSSMVEEVSDTSTQCSVLYNLDERTEDGTRVSLTDENGNELIGWEVPCGFTSVNLSCPGIEQGKTYNLCSGDEITEVTFDSTSVTIGNSAGGFGDPGGNGGPGGGQPGNRTGEDGDFTPPDMPSKDGDFTPPDMPSGNGAFTPPDFGRQGGFGGPGGKEKEDESVIVSTGTNVTELSADVWIWLVSSVAVLVLSLVLVRRYSRRR